MTKKEQETAKIDYSSYAAAAEIPSQTERRKFDFLAVSGGVETEVVKGKDGEEVEKRLPAKAYKLMLTSDKGADGKYPTEDIAVPFSIVPIKLRYVMEAKTGAKGEILSLKSSEFNGNQTDLVTVSKYGAPDGFGDQKVIATYGPMPVSQARQQFLKEDGKQALRDKAHLYSLHNGSLVRFVVRGTGLWEQEADLVNGKGEEATKKFKFLRNYLSEFPIATDPYFIYETIIGAVYRNHGSVKYYRPTFTRGPRISAETEKVVLAHLTDLAEYFAEQDAGVKAFVPTTKVAEEVPVEAPAEVVEGEEQAF